MAYRKIVFACIFPASLGVLVLGTKIRRENELNEYKKLHDAMETAWWNTKPYMDNCGNCQQYALLRPQDSGMYCEKC